jgi:carbon-monoxide dehydrogenase medium subunit
VKPPPFIYHDPATVPEAIALMARLENAKLLAGGQSMMPMLNMRYVMPDHVIDINKIGALSGIEDLGARIRIGAMTRQREMAHCDLLAKRCPIIAEALHHVGHRQTRNRGTLGGSLAHLDPAAELPLVASVLDATVQIAGPDGDRELPFMEFPLAYMTPALAADELLTHLTFVPWKSGHGWAFEEFARRHGDFAIAAVAVLLQIDDDGAIDRVAICFGGLTEIPLRLREAEQLLKGAKPDRFADAAAVAAGISSFEDVHAGAEYRCHLAGVLLQRALKMAYDRCGVDD